MQSKCNQTSFYVKLIVLLLLILAESPLLRAQNLDDFRSAAGSRGGIEIIPYKELKSEANTLARTVDERKKSVENFTYDQFESRKQNIIDDTKKRQEEIKGIEKEIEDFMKAHPDGSATSYKDEINKKQELIKQNESKISDLNNKIKEGEEAFSKLAEARAALRVQFDKVVKALSDSKSSPDKHIGSSPSDEEKNSFFKYIDVIEDEIEIEAKEHKVQEDGAAGTRDRFKALREKNS